MQDGGKVVIAVGVTFTAGVITGWLLNQYTRKVMHTASADGSVECQPLLMD